jgi:hypothetical protein
MFLRTVNMSQRLFVLAPDQPRLILGYGMEKAVSINQPAVASPEFAATTPGNAMKALPLSLCCLAGAIMASVGVIAVNLEHTRRTNNLDTIGVLIAVAALILTAVATFARGRER